MNTMVIRMPRTTAQMFRHLAVDPWLWAPITSPTIFRSLDWGRRDGDTLSGQMIMRSEIIIIWPLGV
ncbi:hypothetical protein QTO34_003176 [Cnephaeus nilssonii]|uniref:Uncharacterized protein n=1 Tax=Cnephaeus nilssonii TaxID=3371016 RepID=A0AA40HR25_CNENI|nr:hypothetical protein QTO34_003176 [Eptesicus nilssonii]